MAGRGRGGFEARGWGRDGGRGRGFERPPAHFQQQQPGDKRPADAAADGEHDDPAKRARLEEDAEGATAEGSLAMLQGYGDDGSGDEGGGAGDAAQATNQADDGGFGDAGQPAGAVASIVYFMCKRCHAAQVLHGVCTG